MINSTNFEKGASTREELLNTINELCLERVELKREMEGLKQKADCVDLDGLVVGYNFIKNLQSRLSAAEKMAEALQRIIDMSSNKFSCVCGRVTGVEALKVCASSALTTLHSTKSSEGEGA